MTSAGERVTRATYPKLSSTSTMCWESGFSPGDASTISAAKFSNTRRGGRLARMNASVAAHAWRDRQRASLGIWL